jgi:nucleosome binding factor SPN SPT16 subunit
MHFSFVFLNSVGIQKVKDLLNSNNIQFIQCSFTLNFAIIIFNIQFNILIIWEQIKMAGAYFVSFEDISTHHLHQFNPSLY